MSGFTGALSGTSFNHASPGVRSSNTFEFARLQLITVKNPDLCSAAFTVPSSIFFLQLDVVHHIGGVLHLDVVGLLGVLAFSASPLVS